MTIDGGFNLLDEPWITVLENDGAERDVSIIEIFEQAPKIVTIGGEVPTQAFAITRLLLAFLHRAMEGPQDQDEWVELWRASELPSDRIRDYAERVRHRFDMFHRETPFYQVADLHTAKGEVSGLEKIVADVPTGVPLFTTRSAASLASISAAEAARWLVHTHAFDPSGIKSGAVGDPRVKGGRGYPIGTGWSGQIGGVIPEGANLRETLVLNMVSADAGDYVQISGHGDVPPWEREPDGAACEDERPVNGAIDLYTWQTRRIRLQGDRDGVTGVLVANGDKITPQNRHGFDPHTAWRYSEPQTKKYKRTVYMPRMYNPNRSVWRGLEAVLPAAAGRHGSRSEPQPGLAPGVLQWLSDLVAEGHLPERFVVRTRMTGVEYGSQSATYAEVVDDRLPLAIAVLREDRPALGRAAVGAVAEAENAAGAIWRYAESLAQAAGAERGSGAGDNARERFYAAAEAPYRQWLASLDPASDPETVRAHWQISVRDLCWPISRELIESAGPAAWVGREINNRTVNAAIAEAWYNAALRKALPHAFARTEEPTKEAV